MTLAAHRLRAVAVAICKSRTCTGSLCCQYSGNMDKRHRCPVERGNFDDAARAAIDALREFNASSSVLNLDPSDDKREG